MREADETAVDVHEHHVANRQRDRREAVVERLRGGRVVVDRAPDAGVAVDGIRRRREAALRVEHERRVLERDLEVGMELADVLLAGGRRRS